MEKCIRSLLILCLLVSCNVVKLATQGETNVPDEFYITDSLPFQTNPLTMTYISISNDIKKIEDLYPNTFAPVGQDNYVDQLDSNSPKAHTDRAWATEWDNISSFSDGTVFGGGDMYESVTWKASNTMNSVCAVGLVIGDKFGLTEYEYPADGTYQADIDAKSAHAMGKYCGTTNPQDIIGMSFPVIISTPGDTTFYDKQIDMMGNTFFLRYTAQEVNFAGVSSGGDFSKLVVANDKTTSGLRLEYVGGPSSGTGTDNDNDSFQLFRMYLDTANNTGETRIMYKVLNDSAVDKSTIFFLGGYAGTAGRLNMKMISSELSNNSISDQYRGCLTQSTWAMHTDNVDCASGNEVSMNTGFDSGTSMSWHFIVPSWSSALGNNIHTVGDTTSPMFSGASTMHSDNFY